VDPAPQRWFHSFVSIQWHSPDIPLSKSGMDHMRTGAVPEVMEVLPGMSDNPFRRASKT